MDSKRDPEEAGSRELPIAAYVLGDMAKEERAEFERRLELEPSLNREVDRWRVANRAASDWMTATPPGIERVRELAIPALKVKTVRFRSRFAMSRRQAIGRGLMAAAIFLIGFGSGRWETPSRSPSDPSIPDPSAENIVGASGGDPKDGPDAPPTLDTEPDPASFVQASISPSASEISPVLVRSSTDEDGRLIIDTENRDSGLRVRWFVEPTFVIAQTNNSF